FLGDEALQKLHVLVVDLRRAFAGERAYFAPAPERAAGRDIGDIEFGGAFLRHDQSSPPSSSPSIKSSPSRPSRRARRRSSRSRRARIGEGSSSSCSTRMVLKRITSSLIFKRRSSSCTAAAGQSRFKSE